jgi:hypothetical protein
MRNQETAQVSENPEGNNLKQTRRESNKPANIAAIATDTNDCRRKANQYST